MYFRFQRSVCLLLASVAACSACHSPLAFGEDPPNKLMQRAEWQTRFEAALDARGEWQFVDVPLNDVCSAIQKRLGIDVVLDIKSLEDFGIDSATPITCSVRGISNRSFLRLMLSELELTFAMRLGALWITTPEYAESRLITNVYPVGDLLDYDDSHGDQVPDYESLIAAVTSSISPDAWNEVGGPGSIQGIYDVLVVSQTYDIHQEIEHFLTAYRKIVASGREADSPNATCLLVGRNVCPPIQAALDRPLTADFEDTPLKEVVGFVAGKMDIPILIDIRALEDYGIDASTPVNARFTETPLRFALARLLEEQELTYTIRDEVLLITTPQECERQLDLGLYPVSDLVQTAGAMPTIDPPGANYDYDSLIRVITSTIAPDSWDEVGGPGAISPLFPTPTLLIAQTQDVHEEISALLTKLRSETKLTAARTVANEDSDPAALIIRSYPIHAALHSPDEIATLVMRASEPTTWEDTAGTFVQGLGMAIVVKHNASIHRRVQKLLTQLGVWNPGAHSGLSGPPGGGGQF